MGFDKTKAMRAAEKSLAQGKIQAAIKEYRQIVEQDSSDFAALNTLGDLYVRVGKKQEAIDCFTRVAEHYREQGFALKAVAMYKKITRLNPDAPGIASKLATLYEQQGLLVEARAQYLAVADAYKRAGRMREALDIMRRIADLDPLNTEIRLRFAESLLAEGIQDEAASAFIEAGERLSANGHHARALEAYIKALDLRPRDRAALNGLIGAHSALGTADEAAEVLEKALAEQPEDVELLAMLVRAYIEAENAPAAERVSTELLKREPSSYAHLFDVARLYLKQDKVDAAVRLLAQTVEPALAAKEEGHLLELLQESLAYNPEQIEALRLLARIHTHRHDDNRARVVLERLVAAAESAGLVDEERRALENLAWLVPYETRYKERLEALGGSLQGVPLAGEDQKSSVSEEVPTFESFMLPDKPSAAETDYSTSGPHQTAPEFEWNSVALPPANEEISFADLNEEFADTHTSPIFSERLESAEQPSHDFQEVDFSAPLDNQPPVTESTAGPAERDERLAALLRQELESVDFYLTQGYVDIARDTLDMLERQYGAHSDIDSRRRTLESASAPAPSPADEGAPALEVPTAEFTDFARYDLAEESHTADAEAAEVGDLFVEQPGGALPATDTTQSTKGAPSQPGIDPGLAAIFDEFRTAVEDEESVSAEDYETHYNLGLAYKEMDLLDEAIEEFQIAVSLVTPQDGTPRYLQCCNLLGHCFMQKGMPRPAAMWFKKGLEAPGHTEDEYQALRYELGTAYEQMGDLDRAIEVFTEVYGINISYRGVSEKLRALQEQRAAK